MKHTQKKVAENIDYLTNLLGARELLEERVRVNLYLPKAVVKIMDSLSDNRGELVTDLVVNKAKAERSSPYGMFTSKTSEADIKRITSMWDKAVDELYD